jgi:LacI family transcriptional regulator
VTRLTLADVAADAGVSRATVSLVLRDSPLVAQATRQRVLASMDRLGYVYHRGAASLRSKQSHTVGLIVTEVSNPFFAELTVGVETTLADAGIVVLLGHNYDSLEKQASLFKVMNEFGVDGLLITPAYETTERDLGLVLSAHVPHVLVTRYILGYDGPYVGVDNVVAARMLTEHLLEHGARKLAFIGGPHPSSARRDRRRGIEEALGGRRRKLPERMSIPTPATREAGYDAAMALLDRRDPPDTIICYNDIVAFGVLMACEKRDVAVGRDVRVAGFDDIAESAWKLPALTTVGPNPRELGLRAARLLLQQIAEPSTQVLDDVVEPTLVIRDSCGVHPARELVA